MRFLLLLAILILPAQALAITGQDARFDFTQGQPTIVSDATAACNNQAKVRFDFVKGQPAQVYDSTATCTAAAGNETGSTQVIIQGAQVTIEQGQVVIQ